MSNINGHDPNENSNITPFPSRAEREEVLRLAAANDAKAAREPVFNLPPMIKILSLAVFLPFIVMEFMAPDVNDQIVTLAGFTPSHYTGGAPVDIWTVLAPLLHMFLHGSWMHVLMNLGMLLAFGAGLERTIGAKRLLILFFATGLLGAVTHLAFYPSLPHPMIGASGAISGLFGAVLMLMQHQGAMGDGYKKLMPFVLVWIGTSLFFGFVGVPGETAEIAWTTHVGGFLAGMALFKPIMRLKIR